MKYSVKLLLLCGLIAITSALPTEVDPNLPDKEIQEGEVSMPDLHLVKGGGGGGGGGGESGGGGGGGGGGGVECESSVAAPSTTTTTTTTEAPGQSTVCTTTECITVACSTGKIEDDLETKCSSIKTCYIRCVTTYD